MMSPLLELNQISCHYQGNTIFQSLSLNIQPGEIACLLGPSGCGKTTVLRAIAGLEPIDGGSIVKQGITISGKGSFVAPHKRGIGLVFQDYALFPHLNVLANIGFGLKKHSSAERKERAHQLLETVGLKQMAQRFPHELSGGQQQRVALARALAVQPELLLLDEPFSNLDVELREELGIEIRSILKAQNITTLLVTHDQHEAFALGDTIGIMNHGKILQWDIPFNIYHDPVDRFVADFIGQGVLIPGTVRGANAIETEIGTIHGTHETTWSKGDKVDVLLRPDDVIADSTSPLQGIIVNEAFKGADILYTIELPSGTRLLSLFPSHDHKRVGQNVNIRIAADHLVAFAHQTATQVPSA